MFGCCRAAPEIVPPTDAELRARRSAVIACFQSGITVLPEILREAAGEISNISSEVWSPSIPSWVILLKLKTLKISGGQITDIRNLQHLAELTTLSFQRCDDLGVIPSTLSSLSSLTELKLEFLNRMSTVDLSLDHFPALQNLVICGCPLSHIEPWQTLQYLTKAHLELPNSLPTFCIKTLHMLVTGSPRLVSLRAIRCHLSSLPAPVAQLSHLIELDVSHNNFVHLPVEIASLRALQTLNISANALVSLPSFVWLLPALRRLDAWQNSIESFETPPPFSSPLQEVFLQRNRLSELPAPLLSCPSLHTLLLQHNRLECIPSVSTQTLTGLTNLNLKDNRLREISVSFFAPLTKLTLLNLGENAITGPVPSELGNLSNLTSLSLNSNKLESVPAQLCNLGMVKSMELNDNFLSSIDEQAFRGWTSLRKLFLNQNELVTLPETIECCTRLLELEISFNMLSSLPACIGNMTSLAVLRADGNPLDSEEAVRYNMLGLKTQDVRSSTGAKQQPTFEIDYSELKLEQSLGNGAFGQVWRAMYHDEKLAVKLLKPRNSETQEQFEQRFALEVRFLREVAVKNYRFLVRFIGASLHPVPCIALQYAENGPLSEYLPAHRSELGNAGLLSLAIDIAWGLFYLHGNDPLIVHGDLKPDNILVDEKGRALISDFGLTRFRVRTMIRESNRSGGASKESLLNSRVSGFIPAPPPMTSSSTVPLDRNVQSGYSAFSRAEDEQQPPVEVSLQALSPPVVPVVSSDYSAFDNSTAVPLSAAPSDGDAQESAYSAFAEEEDQEEKPSSIASTSSPEEVVLTPKDNLSGGIEPATVPASSDSSLHSAHHAVASRTSSLATSNLLVFVPRYAAPEVMTRAEYSTAADIFSFGIVLLELFTGQNAYQTMGHKEIIEFVRQGGRPYIPDTVPSFVKETVMQCLLENPSLRPNAGSLCKTLGKARQLMSEN